ncbi:NAD(P)H-dependent oxidoreductase [Psychromicrobium lacuslunae]|uniref:NAD(P)H-dependent oxidoreductase n=1 Tax=Psychromicrobium lacuslunae TaxID=1618207 RepID=UPI000A6B7010|nr:NAD(P)H-dependent oxidoreductase [Psychromicrobium lacuslunae]
MAENKNILWLSAHPEARSLTGSLRRAGISRLAASGHRVVESDLYRMGWNPVLQPVPMAGQPISVTSDTRRAFLQRSQPEDVAREQQKIIEADALIVQFPLWWYGLPAILKGWFDRVFVSGFAFGKDPVNGRRLRFEQGPFVAKRALAMTTLGDRAASIGPRGKSGELNELLFGLLHGTFAYTGMKVLQPWALPSADQLTEQHYAEVERRFLRRLDCLFSDPVLPYRPLYSGQYTPDWELKTELKPAETGLSVHLEGHPEAPDFS